MNAFKYFSSMLILFLISIACENVFASSGVDTGEFFHTQTLYAGEPSLKIMYRSAARRSHGFGRGWRHNYNIGLRNHIDGSRVIHIGAIEIVLYANGNGYSSRDGSGHLVKNVDGTSTFTDKSGRLYQFDPADRCTSITDSDGNRISIEYRYGTIEVSTVTDSHGRVLTFEKSNGSFLGSYRITVPSGQIFTFFVPGDLLEAVRDNLTATWYYGYDNDGYLTSITPPQGFSPTAEVNTVVYDANHRVIETRTNGSLLKTVTYPSNDTTIITGANNDTWIYTFDPESKVLLKKTDPEGHTTRYTYHSNRQLHTVTEPGDVTTSYSYNSRGKISSITDALGRISNFAYNDRGQILTASGPTGTSTYNYDSIGNLLSTTDTNGAVTRFEGYNTARKVGKITNPMNQSVDYTYNEANLIETVTFPSGAVQSFDYNSAGMPSAITTNGQTYKYDYENGRIAYITDPLSNQVYYSYDKNGKLTHYNDSFGKHYILRHPATGGLFLLHDPKNNSILLSYENPQCATCGDSEKLKSISDGEGKTTTYEYSPAGHLAREIDPLGNVTQYFHEDGRGNLTKIITPNNQTIQYQYDKLNRVTQITLPGNQITTYVYHPTTGYLIGAANANISYSFDHYPDGQLKSVTDIRGNTITYAYNLLRQRTQMALPGGKGIDYGYDHAGRLNTITSEAGIFAAAYDAAGKMTTLDFPNGITTTYGFDTADRLTSLVHAAAGGDILNIAYPPSQLDKLGNRYQRIENGNYTNYSYDATYQLLTATSSQGTETFTYDGVGNRLSGPTVKETPAAAYDYNNGHQMIQGRKYHYTYDANGNQTARILKNGKTWVQEWDAQNRLVRVAMTSGADSRTVTFKYDPFNRRIEKQVTDVFNNATAVTTTTYVYDAEDIVLEIETIEANNVTTTTETRFIHGPGIDEPLAMVRNGQNFYYHADGLGSIVAITDSARAVVQKYGYE
ncbi:MAG: RHS repeat protein, partial [Deltaproteobacteria bacterium]|nr:RHS repeat protein [Deltaproteobacteria bacterium]